MRHATSQMRQQESGSIVNIGSVAALFVQPPVRCTARASTLWSG